MFYTPPLGKERPGSRQRDLAKGKALEAERPRAKEVWEICKNVRCGSSWEITAEVFGSRERDSRKTGNTKRRATNVQGANHYKERTRFAFIQVL
jgi:hypothetical protein